MARPSPRADPRYAVTDFVVTASETERNDLWTRWRELAGVSIVQEPDAHVVHVAALGGGPARASGFADRAND